MVDRRVHLACATRIYLYHFTHEENGARQGGEELCFHGRERHPRKNRVDLTDLPVTRGRACESFLAYTAPREREDVVDARLIVCKD